jgi:hypothetical protein
MAILSIRHTPLWKDINNIINNTDSLYFYKWTARIHNTKFNLDVIKIVNFDLIRDYQNNIGDHAHIEFLLGRGDFIKYFFPFKENCYVTITQTPRTFTNKAFPGGPVIKTKYKLVYLEKDNEALSSIEKDERFDQQALNMTGTVHVKCQCLDLSLEALRILYTGGTFSNTTYEKIMYHTVGSNSMQVKVNGQPAIGAIDITAPDNSVIQPMTVIPDGTPIINIPTYLQEKRKGVYNAGIGMYLQRYNQNNTWFIYPLYNTTIYAKKKNKAILYVVPPQHFPDAEKTFKIEHSTIKIVCIGEKHYVSDGHSKIMDKGNAFRMSSASAYLLKPVVLHKAGPIGARSRLNYEVGNAAMANGLNYGPVPEDEISDNPFVQYSAINRTYTDFITVMWVNSDPDLLYPGMPAKFIYLSGNTLKTITGIIIHTQTMVQMMNVGTLSGVYRSSTYITLIVNKGNAIDKGPYNE